MFQLDPAATVTIQKQTYNCNANPRNAKGHSVKSCVPEFRDLHLDLPIVP